MQTKDWLRTGFVTVFAVLSAAVCARFLLRNLSLFLSFDSQISAIFAQISCAKMCTSVVWVLLSALAFLLLLWYCTKQKVKFAAIFFSVLLWIIAFVSAMLFTRVNDIRFCDVLFSLLEVLTKGGF